MQSGLRRGGGGMILVPEKEDKTRDSLLACDFNASKTFNKPQSYFKFNN